MGPMRGCDEPFFRLPPSALSIPHTVFSSHLLHLVATVTDLQSAQRGHSPRNPPRRYRNLGNSRGRPAPGRQSTPCTAGFAGRSPPPSSCYRPSCRPQTARRGWRRGQPAAALHSPAPHQPTVAVAFSIGIAAVSHGPTWQPGEAGAPAGQNDVREQRSAQVALAPKPHPSLVLNLADPGCVSHENDLVTTISSPS